MAQNSGISTPSGIGGIMRLNEKKSSYFNLSPTHVILFIVLLVVTRIVLEFSVKL